MMILSKAGAELGDRPYLPFVRPLEDGAVEEFTVLAG
jgi:hypothetical protein